MVESPTYYHSMSPILRSLKQFDMENFPLQAEVLYAKSPEDVVQEIPSYLKDATFHTAIVCLRGNSSNLAAETEMDTPKTTKELINNVKTSKEQLAMDTPLLPASILPPSITDASMTTAEENKHPDYCTVTEHFKCGIEAMKVDSTELINNVKTSSKEQPAMDTPLLPASILQPCITDASMTTVYEENKHPDYCTVTEHFKCGIEAMKVNSTFRNNTYEDQMDTDTMSSPETEMCSDIKDTAKIETLPITHCRPFIQRTSRKAQTLPLKERLGSTMNVKRFLEKIKSSTSESFLEESQCKALVHALESRLAVIQGE